MSAEAESQAIILFIARSSMFAERIVEDLHIRTLIEGVNLAMAEIRREYWIRSLTKKVRKACYSCQRFQVTAFNNTPPGELPKDRTVGSRPFEVIRGDYAEPMHYRTNRLRRSKACHLLFSLA